MENKSSFHVNTLVAGAPGDLYVSHAQRFDYNADELLEPVRV